MRRASVRDDMYFLGTERRRIVLRATTLSEASRHNTIYGGSNMGNCSGVHAAETPSHGFRYSLTVTLPSLSGLMLKQQA
ncbi:MAG: hypothetical protein CV088_04220 [Nitrospira sp. LK70]|nr:hypothetical protein [Nitrospira sp. LK70]